jgi:hypothetical protein
LRTISHIEPICLGQGDRLPRFHPRSKAGQGDNGRSQEAKDSQGRERFDHLRLLTVAVSQSRRARGSFYNIHGDTEFLEYNLYLKHGRWLEGVKLKATATAIEERRSLTYLARSLEPKIEAEL